MRRLIAALILLAAVGLALVLTSSGGRATGGTDGARRALPELAIARLDGDGQLALSQLAAAKTPTLLWFWAPWCSVCNGEAAEIQQLAAETDAFNVVAIGGRDDLANAPAFVEQHGMTAPTMLFDETMQVWEHYRIPGQPGAILLDTDGVERGRWLGAFDTNLAVEAARTL
jgi:peroxiredoxin